MKKRKLLSALPEVPRVPRRATGTAHKLGRRKVVKLSPDEMDAIIAHLPELTRKGYPVRDFVTFVRETSLRPSTVFGLQAPLDYEPARACSASATKTTKLGLAGMCRSRTAPGERSIRGFLATARSSPSSIVETCCAGQRVPQVSAPTALASSASTISVTVEERSGVGPGT